MVESCGAQGARSRSAARPAVRGGAVEFKLADAGAEFELDPTAGIVFPLAVAGAGMVASIIGSFFVRTGKDTEHLGKALHRGTNVAAAITAVATAGLSVLILGPVVEVEQPLFFAGAIIGGLMAGLAIGWLSEYYTSDQY